MEKTMNGDINFNFSYTFLSFFFFINILNIFIESILKTFLNDEDGS